MSASSCPICRRAPAAVPYAPFCSKRCADVDLQRWFTGAYAVPAVEADDEALLEGGGPQAGRPLDDPL